MQKEKRKHGEPRRNIFLMLLGFIWKMISSVGKAIGWGISKIAQGGWYAMSNILGFAWHSIGWLIKQPYRLLRYIIVGRIPEFENARQEEIFWRIKRQYRRKRLFALNAFLYTFVGMVSLITIAMRYYDAIRWQETWAWSNFYNVWTSAGVTMIVWTLILIFHFAFNKMGNDEDKALGEALKDEYARSEAHDEYYHQEKAMPNFDRLMDNTEEYEADYYDDDVKPKRNGARL